MDRTTEEIREAVDAFCERIGLKIVSTFVPQSKSRNTGDNYKSINWRVAITSGNYTYEMDYTQGIGHAPPSGITGKCIDQREYESEIAENGKSIVAGKGMLKVKPPTNADILYSLAIDSDALNYASFEEWAREFGYSKDSRAAERIYQACIKTALAAMRLVGHDGLQEIRELTQNY